MEEAGYILAQSDRRDFVLVTAEGSVLSLARELKMKVADTRSFMADVDRNTLPTAAEAKAQQGVRREAAQPPPPPFEMQRPPVEDLAPVPDTRSEIPPPEEETPAAAILSPAVAQALAEREKADAAKLAAWHAAELRQIAYLKLDDEPKMEGLARQHKAERDRLKREQRAVASGMEGYIEALQNRLNPGRGAEKLAARKKEWRQMYFRQAHEKADMEMLLAQNRAEELDALQERHAQQRRDQQAGFERERQRYAADAACAARLLEQIEEDRRAAEQARQQGRGPDGPPSRTK